MNILVAHDGSEHSNKALHEAALLASKFGAHLAILAVVPDLCLSTEEIGPGECEIISRTLDAETQAVMNKVIAGLTAQGLSARLIIRQGRTLDQILDTSEEVDADLVVVGSKGRHGAGRFLMGSVSSKVAEYSKRNVLIVK